MLGGVDTRPNGYEFSGASCPAGQNNSIPLNWKPGAKPSPENWDQHLLPKPGEAPKPLPNPFHFGWVTGTIVQTAPKAWTVEVSQYEEFHKPLPD